MQDRRPRQNTEFLLHLLKNAKSTAELKGLGVDSLLTEHIRVNKAPSPQALQSSQWDQAVPELFLPH
ncbi:hypothetical protein Celaphus_00013543 [Cervus elaphus hippelaphus]|uniref:Uncharacterized protein n=1 Tax=Cervus elaphus hippelaphus TaxID=46360 RepID=A0A212DGY1_CEREH|nr:hypothetical protein Celaphus_00013543 [Cervus elaphus hippelaphus]